MRRVVIVEDHPLMQSALEATLEGADGFTVVGTATSGLQAEPLVLRTQPDLVLLDLQLPGLDGLSCLALLRERHPDATVVVLSGVEDDEMIERALSGGAAALVRKSIAPAEPNSAAAEPFAGPTGSRSTTAATISAAASGSIRMKAAWCPSLFRRGSSGIRPRYT